MDEWQELRDQYRSMETEELIGLQLDGGLSTAADALVAEELRGRRVDRDDHADARHAHQILETERQSTGRRLWKLARTLHNAFIVLVLAAAGVALVLDLVLK